MKGYYHLLLHTHLPFIKVKRGSYILEEEWLFEAIIDTYVPLLLMFERLIQKGTRFKLSMSLTPPILHMFSDPVLMEKFAEYLDISMKLGDHERTCHRENPQILQLIDMYQNHFQTCKTYVFDTLHGNLLNGFKHYRNIGVLEIITCAATHGFLPLLRTQPKLVEAQIRLGVESYVHFLGEKPCGIWLPECGYYEELIPLLEKYGLLYFYVDTHTLAFGEEIPREGPYVPSALTSRLFCVSRDTETSKSVWSREEGYPGDPQYRDFFKDIGFNRDSEELKPFNLLNMPVQRMTGYKYFRITDKHSDFKEVYDPEVARSRIMLHAQHFVSERLTQIQSIYSVLGREPMITSTYDTELFGHWWYEGTAWLEEVFTLVSSKNESIELINVMDYIDIQPVLPKATLCPSSWGFKGFNEFWLNETNEWIYPRLQQAALSVFASIRLKAAPSALHKRILTQAFRELLLASASDYAFIMRTKTMDRFAKNQTKIHLERIKTLMSMLTIDQINESELKHIEEEDSIFPFMDYKMLKELV